MTGMELKLDPESVTAIASAAIYDHLSDEARESVIKQAIEYLMTPTKSTGYGVGKTPLQTAFDQAITTAAYKVVRERIEDDPEVRARIEELLGPLLNGALVGSDFDGELANTLGTALGSYLAENARRQR